MRIVLVIGLAGSLCLTASGLSPQDTIRTRVDLVVVPVSVRGPDGRVVYGLTRDDFTVLEDGRPQTIQDFSSDRTTLSAAVLIDTGLGGNSLRRFAKSVISLTSAFVEPDEVALYRYDYEFVRLADFSSDAAFLEGNLRSVQQMAEGKPVQNGAAWNPLAGRGPKWLQKILNVNAQIRILHDAIFKVVSDLEKRPAENRKMILVISDGYASGDTAISFEAARDRLIRSQIQVYAVSVDMALLEGPLSVLNAYAMATGGDTHGGRTQLAMENAFGRISEQARYQYVLGYVSNQPVDGLTGVQRKIEVKIPRPGLRIRHRQTYMQFPAPR